MPKMVVRICGYCGNAFNAPYSEVKRGNGKFCSVECANEIRRKPKSQKVMSKT